MESNSSEVRRTFNHTVPCYVFENGRYIRRQERAYIDSDKPPMGRASRVISHAIPDGYTAFTREALLLDGQTEEIIYGIHHTAKARPRAFERAGPAVIAAFAYVLETNNFADDEPIDNVTRSEELGTLFGYALYEGLTDEEILVCYNTAYIARKGLMNPN